MSYDVYSIVKVNIIAKFISVLDKRITVYISKNFLFITKLNIQPDNDINLSLNDFICFYKDYIEPYIKKWIDSI